MMAAKNYYSILDVSRSATKEEIKQAYRNLALKFHPDKSDKAGAEERFKDIAEAYRVLSAEEERQKYDRFEEKINFFTRETKSRDSGGPDIFFDGPGLKKPKTSYENENGDAGATFINDFFDDEDFLTEMMNDITFLNGSTRSGPRRTTHPVPTFEQQFFHDTTNFEFSTPNKKFKPEVQGPPVEKELLVSLEELNTGITKKFNISRKVYNPNGSFFFEDKLLIITVMPGWKEGTKITFSKEGDRNPGVIPADIVFKLKDKTHKDFSRDNENNLIYNCKISLCEALVGASVDIPTIDGKFLRITHDEIIQPGTQKLIKGEGLPRPNNPSTRADLIVKYEIFFPSYLSPHQREIISNFLPS